jgi:hypothetical protein
LGITKTLRPVFAVPPEAAALDEEPAAAELAGAELDAAELDEDDEFELQAARIVVAATGIAIASASFLARLRRISLYPFNLWQGRTECLGCRPVS